MTIEIKHKITGEVLHTVNAPDLREADLQGENLRWADLTGTNLRGTNLRGADLTGADLTGADLTGADLTRADLREADLTEANLQEADLTEADLTEANLQGVDLRGVDLQWVDLQRAIMPDGRTYDQWRADPLAGLCDTPEATNRAIAAWGDHTWEDCPMHAAHGWNGIEAAPEQKRQLVATFVALFDGRLLPAPQPQQGSENK